MTGGERLRALLEAAEALERQAAELRERIAELAGSEPLEPAEREERSRIGDPASTAPVASPTEPADDSEARIVAYSMVLDGRPREEVARHLADELGMTDAEALLDDLYARADS